MPGRLLFLAIVVLCCWTGRAPAQGLETVAPGCKAPADFKMSDDELGLGPAERLPVEKDGWGPCEKWAWSCVRRGLEVNVSARDCYPTRSKKATQARKEFALAPFENAARWMENAFSSAFVVTVLTKKEYSSQLTPNGVRIVGAYFQHQLNLENVTTSANLVLDQAVCDNGVRLTNFESTKNVSFDGSNIHGRILMNRMRLAGSLFLEDGVFDNIDVRDARIGASIDASGSFFVGTVRLDRARVEGKITLVNSRLTEISGWDLVVGGSFWLRNADIRGRLDLTGARIAGDMRMQKVTFGRERDVGEVSCDWDLRGTKKLFLDEINKPDQKARLDGVVSQILAGRPMDREPVRDMCFRVTPDALASGAPQATDDAGPTRREAEAKSTIATGSTGAAPAIAGAASSAILPAGRPAISAEPVLTAAKTDGKRHEVRLRDMTIDGTLCLIDLTGEIKRETEVAPTVAAIGGAQSSAWNSQSARYVDSISMDGTRARSTIIRWKQSDSRTQWRAVQFTTGNLLLDLSAQPKSHYIDNLEIATISFIKTAHIPDPEILDEDFYPYLCDMRPGAVQEGSGAGSAVDPASLETHRSIVRFFTSEANTSRSAQPFAKIAERLNESGASSLYLKMELGDYTSRRQCSSSEFFKAYEGQPPQTWSAVWPRARDSFDAVWGPGKLKGWRMVEEAKNIGLDGACRGMFKAYKYTAAYGHQPHNVFIVIAAFVVIFRLLLLLDTPRRPEFGGRSHNLGMLYSIDMFVPFVKLNAEHATWQPDKNWLRGYLIFHRVIGLILTSLLVLGLYTLKQR